MKSTVAKVILNYAGTFVTAYGVAVSQGAAPKNAAGIAAIALLANIFGLHQEKPKADPQ